MIISSILLNIGKDSLETIVVALKGKVMQIASHV